MDLFFDIFLAWRKLVYIHYPMKGGTPNKKSFRHGFFGNECCWNGLYPHDEPPAARHNKAIFNPCFWGWGADPVLSKTVGCSVELTWQQWWWWSRIQNRKGLNFVRSLGNSMDSPYKRLDYIITTFALLLSHCPVYNDGWCQLCPTFNLMRSPLSLG